MPLDLPPDLEAKLRVVAEARGEDYNHFAVAVLADALAHDAAATQVWERAEAQAILNGPFHPFDPAADRRRIKEKYGIEIEDLSHLSDEELAERTEATLAALPPEKVAEAERLGLI